MITSQMTMRICMYFKNSISSRSCIPKATILLYAEVMEPLQMQLRATSRLLLHQYCDMHGHDSHSKMFY